MTHTKPIPTDAIKRHQVIVGMSGSGKTFTAKGVVEGLLEEGRRVCIIDPTGVWWGLKSKLDGNGEGYPVAIFGGARADVNITVEGAKDLADMIAGDNLPAIIDLSEMTLTDQQRFATAFFERLYLKNRKPLHLVIDEADVFAPQAPLPDQRLMLNRIDQIVRRGRARGFRVTMITQRPAVIHKNVLSQCPTLVAMQLTGSHDRKAIEEWIKGQADESDGREVLGSLAALPQGEGWVWSPASGILDRHRFPMNRTFDSSRTPDDDEEIPEPRKLARVDIAGLEARLNPPEPAADKVEEKQATTPKLVQADLKAAEARGFESGRKAGRTELSALFGDRLAAIAGSIAAIQVDLGLTVEAPGSSPLEGPGFLVPQRPPAAPSVHETSPDLKPGALKLVQAFVAYHPRTLTIEQAAKLAGQSIRSSAFRENRKALKDGGWLEECGGDHFAPSAAAFEALGSSPIDLQKVGPNAALELWKSKLSPSHGRMLDVLRDGPRDGLSREDVAGLAGVSPKSSGFREGFAELVRAGLAERHGQKYALHTDYR